MATSSDNKDNNNEEEEQTCVFSEFTNVNEFAQQALRSVLQATKSSNDLPVGDDYDFYSTFRSVRDVMDIEGRRILSIIQKLLRHQGVRGGLRPGDTNEIEEKFDVLLDVNDQLLERVGNSLDEASGIKKEEKKLVIAATTITPSKSATSWNKKPQGDVGKAASAYRLLAARNIQRPQLKFKEKIDNSSHPFRPRIRVKPHALVTLEASLQLPEGVTLEEAESPNFVHPHPYRVELERFKPQDEQLTKVDPQEPTVMGLTPLLMVETLEKLEELTTYLQTQMEFAIDLEHHSYRSYQGITCLMQISTRTHDYIVDTLELRDDMHILNQVFTDPKITKVLHGCDSDVLWLQRDFGLYLVNVFDTGQAARILNFSRFNLATLLMNYCRIEADKQFQLADWRIRPLPEELIKYAREDTHYLLYIYDMMRNQLIDNGNEQANLLRSVYDRSALVAAKVYSKPASSGNEVQELYKKSRKSFNNQQRAALEELFKWRDHMARTEDESWGYVLPNHMMLQMAEILPRERQGVLACCNPIPPLVRQNLPEMHGIIMQAREITLEKVEKKASLPSAVEHPKYDANSILNCPHDTTHLEASLGDIERNIAETGMVAQASFNSSTKDLKVVQKSCPLITAFHPIKKNLVKNAVTQAITAEVRKLFSSPFTKYFRAENNGKVKPEQKDIWRLKPPTAQKRKADDGKVNLNTFEPEFVPPQKKLRVSDTPDIKTEINQPKGSSLFQVPTAPSANTSTSIPEKNPKRSEVEKQIKSLRQEADSKKKKEKKKNKMKKQEGKARESSENIKEEVSLEKTSEPKLPDEIKSEPTVKISKEGHDERKKNKKKKITMEDVGDLAAFNYGAAEASFSKAKSKNKDVYDCALPSRDGKKEKVKKTKMSGPKSNKNISFHPK